jgi:hypothetical protein
MKFRVFKLPQHTRFEFTPRYYDPVKEEIEEKKARMAAYHNASTPEERAAHVRERISAVYQSRTKPKPAQFTLLLRIATVVSLTGLVLWLTDKAMLLLQ